MSVAGVEPIPKVAIATAPRLRAVLADLVEALENAQGQTEKPELEPLWDAANGDYHPQTLGWERLVDEAAWERAPTVAEMFEDAIQRRLPWTNRLWWQLVSHKYLRLAAPGFMLLMFVSNALIAGIFPYGLLFCGQCAFYVFAVVGTLFSRINLALFSIPAGFVFLNVMAVSGLRHYLRGSYRRGVWPSTTT